MTAPEVETFPYQNPELSVEERVRDLVQRLTLEEKAGQMLHEAKAVERLGIPAYNWWNEALHGVARAGVATVFPQAIGLAAMWNAERLFEVAQVISDEARAKHHESLRQGDRDMYRGLTFWSPNINIFRDPRWGRGHETYGECPYLTSRLGVVFCRGLEGDDPKYLKLVATPKHYAVHSGPEGLRHSFDAITSPKDLRETYLPAFHACITEAGAHSIMGAYNRTNGEVCCGSETLLVEILREEWQFQGYVVSDCWAVRDFHEHHKVTATPEASVALAIKNGCDLNCGCTYEVIPRAVQQGLLSEADLDACVARLLRGRMQLGMFDPPERVPFASIPFEANDTDEHRALALQTARESIVLLKNAQGLLPLDPNLKSIAVIGPNADDNLVLRANYAGVPSHTTTPLEGIRAAVSAGTQVWYAEGCDRSGRVDRGLHCAWNPAEARSLVERADVAVLCLGLSAEIEGEQGDVSNSDAAGDKAALSLTGLQQRLLEQVVAVGKPTIVVLVAGSAIDLSWAHEHVDAIIDAWYPGGEGGTAIADVLFGKYCPAGRLPITFPASVEDVPPITDYDMRGRTYRYLTKEPLYPFGYGLSYATFAYEDLAATPTITGDQDVTVAVTVRNTSQRAADEVVELYVQDLEASCRVPHRDLRGFRRIHLEPGASQRVEFTLTPRDLSLIDEAGKRVLEPGKFRISVGGSQPDARSVALMGRAPIETEIEVTGNRRQLPY